MPLTTSAACDRLRERAKAELAAGLPEHLHRLGWDRAQLGGHQRERLRYKICEGQDR